MLGYRLRRELGERTGVGGRFKRMAGFQVVTGGGFYLLWRANNFVFSRRLGSQNFRPN